MSSEHTYKPSLSSGVYGQYTLNPVNPRSVHNYNLSEFKQIYIAAKTAEMRTKIVFKPECNYKGCKNKPSVDPKWLKGDMFIWKEHRIEMAQKLKESNVKSPALFGIISKLQSMTDEELLSQGLELEANDFCVMAYSAAYYQKINVAKEILATKRSQSRYWKLKMQYKQLQNECDFLMGLRKISNPFLTALIVAAVITTFACGLIVGCVLCNNVKTGNYLYLEAARQRIRDRAKNEEENKEQLKEVNVLIKELDKQIIRNADLKKQCILLIQKEDEKYKDGMKKIAEEFETNIAEKTRKLQDQWDGDIKQKEKDLDDLLDQKEVGMEQKLASAQNEWDKKLNTKQTYWELLINDKMNETNPWIAKTENYQSALLEIKSKITNTINEIAGLDTECKKLMNALDDEEEDMDAWDKKLDRLEKLEAKREDFKVKLMKQRQQQIKCTNDMKMAEDEKKEWNEKRKVEVDALKAQKDVELHAVKQQKQYELDVLRQQKDIELKAMQNQKEEELKAMRSKKKLEIENMEKQQESERKIREQKLKEEMGEQKEIQREKMKKFEAEQEETDYQRAKAMAEKLCREQNVGDEERYTFIVYHKDYLFDVVLHRNPSYSSGIWDYHTWRYVGNWRICKVRTKGHGNLRTTTWWRYSTEDPRSVWYDHLGETKKVTYGSGRDISFTYGTGPSKFRYGAWFR